MGTAFALWWAQYGVYVILAVSVASSAYSIYTAKKGVNDSDDQAGYRVSSRSSQKRVRVMYGQHLTAGNELDFMTSDNHGHKLWFVEGYCEGEVEGIAWNGPNEFYVNGKHYSAFTGATDITIDFYKGTDSQTYDTGYQAKKSAFIDNMRHLAYAVMMFKFDPKVFQGPPQKKYIIMRGKKIYDFRDDTTAYSTNAVLQLWDYMTSERYGRGIHGSKFDYVSWSAAATYFDNKGWESHYIVDGQTAQRVIDDLLRLFRGTLVWFDGVWFLRYSDMYEETTERVLTDTDIIRTSSGKASVTISKTSEAKKPTGVLVGWVDPDRNYIEDDFIIGNESGYVMELPLKGCHNKDMATQLGNYYLEKARATRAVAATLRDYCVDLEPNSLVSLTTNSIGYSDMDMRVEDANVTPSGEIQAMLSPEALSMYNDVYDSNEDSLYDTTLISPDDPVPPLENAVITEETYIYNLITRTRIYIDFDIPENYPWLDHIDVYISLDGGVTYTYSHPVQESFHFERVEEGKNYFFKLVPVNFWDVSALEGAQTVLSHSVVGIAASAPGSLAALDVVKNANTVNLYALRLSSGDVEVYEFRLGNDWVGSIFLASLRSPNYSLYGVKPGTHTFFCNTLGSNGIYGTTAVSATVTLPDPPIGWTIDATFGPLVNRLTNGNMELDSNWTSVGSPPQQARVTTQKVSGSYSRGFQADATNEGIKSDAFTMNNGEHYLFGLQVFPSDTTNVKIRIYDGDGTTYEETTVTGLTQDAWNDVAINFESTVGGASARIEILSTQSSGIWYVDDVVCVRGQGVNCIPVIYSLSDVYLKLMRESGAITGSFTSRIHDNSASEQNLAYVLTDFVFTGAGTAWEDQGVAGTTTWEDMSGGDTTKTWRQIFGLAGGSAKVEIALKNGVSAVSENTVNKMEILSTVVTARYFQYVINITDPDATSFVMVEGPTFKLCQR